MVHPPSRRQYLRRLAAAGSLALAGCSSTGGDGGSRDGGDGTSGGGDGGSSGGPTSPLPDDRARALAERFAPTLYFEAHERWFPTDPRPYTTERDGETVVDGFAALDGYTERFHETDGPPAPTLFYNAVRYDGSPLGVVQWWAYSAFDQFTTNFHWHDWEVLHAFVDLETGVPQLYVASAHSRSVPNNEYLDPDPDRVPHVLAELGSHSSALSINEDEETFQRLPGVDLAADITNSAVDALEALADLPAAYGLPRDEGLRLPYLVPELDGEPVYEHPDLPAVERGSLIDESLTVRSFADLTEPPSSLPTRETGTVLGPAGRDGDHDTDYALVPTTELEHITGFTGPQLSFEFAVPDFAEDLIANHITSTGVPWRQPRYSDPAADITEPAHRAALADRYDVVDPPAGVTLLVAALRQAVETDDAPEGEGLTTQDPTVEGIALLESEPETIPSFRGAVVARDLPDGEHRLTVNAAGAAPHSETVALAPEAPTVAGAGGSIPLVANADAVKVGVDPTTVDADLRRLAVEDDFAGRLYDAPLDGPDAVYVHRGGAYTAEVEDADGALGAHRVNPAEEARVTVDRPETGKAVLATYVADVVAESRTAVADRDDAPPSVTGLVRAMEAVTTAARRAAERAEAGTPGRADEALGRVADRLQTLGDRLAAARGALPTPLGNAIDRRLEQARRRTDQALASEKL